MPTETSRPHAPLLQVRRIWAEPDAIADLRGQQVLARYPDAEIIDIASHWQIPELHGNEGNIERWVRVKTEDLVLGVKKSLSARPNGRSADWIAPSTANGCAMACAYCYVPRRKGYANPITVFTNIDQIVGYLGRHIQRQGPKLEANQCDPVDWVYDIGENSDCSVDATVSDNVADLIGAFAGWDGAKASFATKCVNRDLLELNPRGGTRIRFSLMPKPEARLLDIRTSSIDERLTAIDDFVDAGYEVHLNFSPVVISDGWQGRWSELLDLLDDATSDTFKRQAAVEIIMLTHNEGLHETNLGWHPRAERVLWTPEIQQPKQSQSGGTNVRYRNAVKARAVAELTDLIGRKTPWLTVRYAF
jgi:spore photoproduct lyase family protein